MRRIATKRVDSAAEAVGPYSLRVSDDSNDAEWDDFVESSPMGHHAQTSCWGRARAHIDWRPLRLIISSDGRIVAGAQMVTRPMPFRGRVGFVCRGPVVPTDRADLAKTVVEALMALGRRQHVQYLVIQPPRGGDWICRELTALGFKYGAFDIDHTSTILLSLSPDLPEIRASLKKSTRKNLGQGEKGGVTVRRGSVADVPIFNHLKDVHSARLGYARREDGYYEELWRALAPRGHIELFIAEYNGEPISAQLAIPFGNTCRHLERPWSGEHGDLRPNELLEWEVIKWAKSEGYGFTDLEGIEPPLAEAVMSGDGLPDDPEYSASRFKLRLVPPGRIIVDPPSYDYVFSPVLRLAYRCIPNKVMRSTWMKRLLFAFRETGS